MSERFWSSSIEEICKGYVYEEKDEEYICLICGKRYGDGIIYNEDGLLMEAKKAAKNHIALAHGSMFDYLINMDKKYTGLTEVQKKLLEYFQKGYNDKEIVKLEGEGSTSTIRNHRFKLKEKEKQAKIFLAMMNILQSEENNKVKNKSENLVEIHRGATMVDERYAITEEEKEKVLKNYIKDDKLTTFPSSEKKKIIIIQYLITKFDNERKYTEKEVNEVIREFYEDFATLRRYLVEYGFLAREKDCSFYWVNS